MGSGTLLRKLAEGKVLHHFSQLSFSSSQETSTLEKLYDRIQEWDVELRGKSVHDERHVLRPTANSLVFLRGILLFFRRGGGSNKGRILFHSQGNTLRKFRNSFNKAESGSLCGFSNMSSSHITRVLDQWVMEIIHWSGTLAKNIWVNYPYLSNIWIFLHLSFYFFFSSLKETNLLGRLWFHLIWESVNK